MRGLKFVIIAILNLLCWLFTRARMNLSPWSALPLFSSPTQAVFLPFIKMIFKDNSLAVGMKLLERHRKVWIEIAEISQKSICLLENVGT